MRGLNELYQKTGDPFTAGVKDNKARVVELLLESAIPGIDGNKAAAEEYYYEQVFKPTGLIVPPALVHAGLQVNSIITVNYSEEDLPNDQLLDLFVKRFGVSSTSKDDINALRTRLRSEGDVETGPVMTPTVGYGGSALRMAGMRGDQMLNEVAKANKFLTEANVATVSIDGLRAAMIKMLQLDPVPKQMGKKHETSVAGVLDNEHGISVGGWEESGTMLIGPVSYDNIGFKVVTDTNIVDITRSHGVVFGALASLRDIKNASRPSPARALDHDA